MNVEVESAELYSVVAVKPDNSKLDSTCSPELKAQLVTVVQGGQKNIILDLAGARYCDSSGLSAILVGNRLTREAEGVFVICNVQSMVQKLITISQLDSILTIVPTLDEARQYMMMEEAERGFDND